MNKIDFKESLYNALSQSVDEHSFDERMRYAEDVLIQFQDDNEDKRDVSEKHRPWSDEDLTVILTSAPTKYNCMKYAKIYKRGFGSIEQIYRWASTPKKIIKEKYPDDSFKNQIKKIATQVGFRA